MSFLFVCLLHAFLNFCLFVLFFYNIKTNISNMLVRQLYHTSFSHDDDDDDDDDDDN